MPSYNVVAATDRYTVMSEYTRTTRGSEAYQSEAEMPSYITVPRTDTLRCA